MDKSKLPAYVSKYAIYWCPLEVADIVGAIKSGLNLSGVSGATTLPTNTAKSFTANFAGGGGDIDIPTNRNREAASIEIPVLSYGLEFFDLPTPGQAVMLQLRSEVIDIQRFGIPTPDGFTFIYRGIVKEKSPGKMEGGTPSEPKLSLSITYEEIFHMMKPIYTYDWINGVELHNGVPIGLGTSIFV